MNIKKETLLTAYCWHIKGMKVKEVVLLIMHKLAIKPGSK